MTDMNEIEVGEYFLMRASDGVLYITVKPGIFVELPMVQEVVQKQRELQKGKPSLVLLDISRANGISKEAREYTSGKHVEGLSIAMAMLVSSLSIRLLANFFIKFNQPPSPTKMFNNMEGALEWLESFR